jgi:hypothetical protein
MMQQAETMSLEHSQESCQKKTKLENWWPSGMKAATHLY